MTYLYVSIGFFVLGLVVFRLFLWYLPTRLGTDNQKQREELMRTASDKSRQVKSEEIERTRERIELLKEDFESHQTQRQEDLKVEEEDIDSRERLFEMEENRLKTLERDLEVIKAKVQSREAQLEQLTASIVETKTEVRTRLAAIAKIDLDRVVVNLRDQIVDQRQLESKKMLKTIYDDLEQSSKRHAQRMLSRTMARYAPTFPWPKAINQVEIPDISLVEILQSETERFIPDFKELI